MLDNLVQQLIQAAIREAIPAIVQAVQGQIGGGQAQQGFQQPVQHQADPNAFGTQPQYNPNQQANGFGAPQNTGFAPQQQAQAVTPDMIQTLITPLVQNEQCKQALTAQMQAMGIQNLPDARPDQLTELYARFQQVAAQFQGGGQAQHNAGSPSII